MQFVKLRDSAKIVVGLVFCIAARLALAPLPNVEPIMGTLLPFAKKYGSAVGAVFAFLTLISIDFVTGRLGLWTVYCGLAYAGVGFAAGAVLPKFRNDWKLRWRFAGFAAVGVIAYDLVTATAFGVQFGQPFEATLLAQIPFTAYHLLGGVAFTLVFSPLLYTHFVAGGTASPEAEAEAAKGARA